jgi:NAD(P)-dependent dehydrogenase (short-subunit alcohol dehydrogenase family)
MQATSAISGAKKPEMRWRCVVLAVMMISEASGRTCGPSRSPEVGGETRDLTPASFLWERGDQMVGEERNRRTDLEKGGERVAETPGAGQSLAALFDIRDCVAVVTGGSGHLGRAMASALARAGARVALLARRAEAVEAAAAAIRDAGGVAVGVACDVLDRAALEQAHERILGAFGPVDILVNAAGGNAPAATTSPEQPFFALDAAAVNEMFALNVTGSLLACQVFGRDMAERGEGRIVNIASMSGLRPLTRVVAYSAAKAAFINFTQWLAVHMAQEYSPHIRVNAIAPGFFHTEQNRYLLLDMDGGLTARGQAIISHTPARRLGLPEDLAGTLLWLASPASAFVTGVVIPVDGGFSCFSGV